MVPNHTDRVFYSQLDEPSVYPSIDLFDREAENVLNLEKAGTLLTVRHVDSSHEPLMVRQSIHPYIDVFSVAISMLMFLSIQVAGFGSLYNPSSGQSPKMNSVQLPIVNPGKA